MTKFLLSCKPFKPFFHLSLKAQNLLNKSFPIHLVDEETGTTKFDDLYMIIQDVSDTSGNGACVGS